MRLIWPAILLVLLTGTPRLLSPETLGWEREPDAPSQAERSTVKTETVPFPQSGLASYYAEKYHGKPTASGEIFNMHNLTAAHRTLRFGTRVKVTHLANGRFVILHINDRGPFIAGRIIDLSLAAAEELQMVPAGLAEVRIEVEEIVAGSERPGTDNRDR